MIIDEYELEKHLEELNNTAIKAEALCQILMDATETNAVENAYMIFGLDILHNQTQKLSDKTEEMISEYLIQPLC